MDSYFSGRKQANRLRRPLLGGKEEPSPFDPVDSVEEASAQPLITVLAPVAPTVKKPPKVELVMEGDLIRKILISCENGQFIELECEYDTTAKTA
jgi:hypothetical protein